MHRLLVVVVLALAAPVWAQTGTVAFSSSTFSVDDTEPSVEIDLVVTGGTNVNGTVNFRTLDGSARAGVDYQATTGTLTVVNGELDDVIEVILLTAGNAPSNQTFRVELFNPTGVLALASPSNTVVTVFATASPELNLSSDRYNVVRRVGSAIVTVLRTGDSSEQVSVNYLTFDETAESGVDYLPTNGTLIFRPGESHRSFSFRVLQKPTFEENKFVRVELEAAVGADLGPVSVAQVMLVNDKTQTITFTEDDGDEVTMTLKSAGTMEPTDELPPFDLLLSGTDETSVLTIKIKKSKTGDGLIEIDSITGDGSCRTIDAPGVDLTGDGVQLDGYLGNLRVHDILNGAPIFAGGSANQRTKITAHEIDFGTAIEIGSRLSLTAARFGPGSIDAPSADSISIRGDKKLGIPGDFEAHVTLTGEGVPSNQLTLNRLSASGAIFDVIIWIDDGSVGSVSAGEMFSSSVSVGYFPDDDIAPFAGGEFTPGLSLRSVSVRSTFEDSLFAASKIGNVRLGNVTIDNGGVPFGVLADESVGSVSGKSPPIKWIRTGASDQSWGDFHVVH